MEQHDILYAQYCHWTRDLYYQPIEIYGDDPDATDEAIEMMANSTESWSLCDGAPPMQGHPIITFGSDAQYDSEMEFDRQIIEQNNRLAYQGLLDNCEDVGITKAELQEAQAPLSQGIGRPEQQEWERMRKYFGNVPAKTVRNTFKHTTQIGTLPPSSHLQRQFKSPNPALNLHRRNEADATDQIFAKVPAMDGGETSDHIFVGQDSKITDVYKSKDNSAEVFLGCFQDRVRERGVLTKLIADNCPMYRGWNVAKYLRDLVVSIWQCETKHQNQNPAENQYQTVKRHTDRTMDCSGAPPAAWFLCLVYICFCLNNCVDPNLGDGTKSPIMMCCLHIMISVCC